MARGFPLIAGWPRLRGSASRRILVARGHQRAILREVGAPALWLALLAGGFVLQAAVVLWRAQ